MKVKLEATVVNPNAKPRMRAKRSVEFEISDETIQIYEALALDPGDVLVEVAKAALMAGRTAAVNGGQLVQPPTSSGRQAATQGHEPPKPTLSRPGPGTGISEEVKAVVSSKKGEEAAREMDDILAIMGNLSAMEKQQKQSEPSPGPIGYGPHRNR